jgi:hypothetical protein
VVRPRWFSGTSALGARPHVTNPDSSYAALNLLVHLSFSASQLFINFIVPLASHLGFAVAAHTLERGQKRVRPAFIRWCFSAPYGVSQTPRLLLYHVVSQSSSGPHNLPVVSTPCLRHQALRSTSCSSECERVHNRSRPYIRTSPILQTVAQGLGFWPPAFSSFCVNWPAYT